MGSSEARRDTGVPAIVRMHFSQPEGRNQLLALGVSPGNRHDKNSEPLQGRH